MNVVNDRGRDWGLCSVWEAAAARRCERQRTDVRRIWRSDLAVEEEECRALVAKCVAGKPERVVRAVIAAVTGRRSCARWFADCREDSLWRR
jgi:hypothetical protein